ncbi:hypothetical protein [Streptosporangium sp. LJ11]|uniref:hypothetical protein n=1 Tax=Streptosporangium sp. LJ11 TaxID=3436927 RepID=UPI003F7964BD
MIPGLRREPCAIGQVRRQLGVQPWPTGGQHRSVERRESVSQHSPTAVGMVQRVDDHRNALQYAGERGHVLLHRHGWVVERRVEFILERHRAGSGLRRQEVRHVPGVRRAQCHHRPGHRGQHRTTGLTPRGQAGRRFRQSEATRRLQRLTSIIPAAPGCRPIPRLPDPTPA